jgi:hypothetical protein
MLLADEVAGDLVEHEEKAEHHHEGVGMVCLPHEAAGFPPVGDGNQNDGQCQKLSDFHADIEEYEVGEQTIRRDIVFQNFGCQTKTMNKAEPESGYPRVRLPAEPALIGTHVIERFVYNREPDDGIDDIGAYTVSIRVPEISVMTCPTAKSVT